MDDIRRQTLLAHRDMLKDKPYDAHGSRYAIIGSMYTLFGENEDAILAGMQQLGKDMASLGMTLSSYPHRPDLLCIQEKE